MDNNPEKLPQGGPIPPDQDVLEHLGLNTCEEMGLVEHEVLFELSRVEQIRVELLRVDRYMQNNQCFFRSYANNGEYRVLVNRQPGNDHKQNTIISVNLFRSPRPNEPNYPFGRAIDLLDACIPDEDNGLYYRAETVHIERVGDKWPRPQCASLLMPGYDADASKIDIYGGIRNVRLDPKEPVDIEDMGRHAVVLMALKEALLICNDTGHENKFSGFIKK